MKKVIAIMVLIGIIVMSFAGCTTTQYRIRINNVQNIREVNIRNAGTTSWGMNWAGNLDNIDGSRFSERVDIRVIDTNGIVHSRYNLPFDAGAFEVTRERYTGVGTSVLLSIILIGALIPLIIFGDFGNGEQQ